jgi:hypothetical protein
LWNFEQRFTGDLYPFSWEKRLKSWTPNRKTSAIGAPQ